MKSDKVIEIIQSKSLELGLPLVYKDDLLVDYKIAKKYGNCDYIFMLRDCGSLLFPLGKGINPTYIINYVKDDMSALFFLIDDNGISQVKREKVSNIVERLPEIPYTSKDIINKVKHLLEDENILNTWFHSARIPSTEPAYWQQWAEWFRCQPNHVMHNFMKQVIKSVSNEQ